MEKPPGSHGQISRAPEAKGGAVPDRPSRTWQFSKTKMCKFQILGMCAKGEQCPFAHDRVEMKPLPDLTCTKLCKVLIQTGTCGVDGCTYAHSKEELRATSTFHKTKLCRFSQLGHCALGLKCNFAHSEEEIRKLETEAPGASLDFAMALNPQACPPAGWQQSKWFREQQPQQTRQQPLHPRRNQQEQLIPHWQQHPQQHLQQRHLRTQELPVSEDVCATSFSSSSTRGASALSGGMDLVVEDCLSGADGFGHSPAYVAYVTQTASDFPVRSGVFDSSIGGGLLRPIRSAAGRLDQLGFADEFAELQRSRPGHRRTGSDSRVGCVRAFLALADDSQALAVGGL